jgi:hypothetical protein
MVNVSGLPVQPAAIGIIVIVAVIELTPALTAIKVGISPLPEEANPIDGSELDQL